jgi:hypothetical protein
VNQGTEHPARVCSEVARHHCQRIGNGVGSCLQYRGVLQTLTHLQFSVKNRLFLAEKQSITKDQETGILINVSLEEIYYS